MHAGIGKIVAVAVLCAGAAPKDAKKAEETNRKVFQHIVDEAINGRNLAVFDEVGAATLVDHDLPPGTPAGPAGTKAKINAFLTGFPDVKFVFESVLVDGDKIAGRGYFTGTHTGTFNGVPASGKSVKVEFQDQWRFENGKLVEYWGAPNVMSLLTQIGALPQPKKQM